MAPPCPVEHGTRLAAAGVAQVQPRDYWHPSSMRHRCPEHDCPLCVVRFGGFCEHCELQAIAVARFEAPIEDPRCPFHGGVINARTRRRDCGTCTAAWTRAKRLGWRRPTGHEGTYCGHCWVCGLCKGSGRVCGRCFTCLDHASVDWAENCYRTIWSRAYRREVPILEHRLWTGAAWAS